MHVQQIYVAGHQGLVGSALMRALQQQGYHNIITRTSGELDLRNQQAVNLFFAQEKPDFVFLCAAKVGGINANMTYPAEFIYDNLMISANVVHASYECGVQKLLYLGSSCIYPRLCPQPIKEDYLLAGCLEPTNEPYAVAKIAGIKLCQSYNRQFGTRFISCMPTNLYGTNDNFSLQNSHVIPALIRKIHEAKMRDDAQAVIWGSGRPRREFLYVDDLADALIFLMQTYEGNEIVNIGTGVDSTIAQLAQEIKQVVGFAGELVFDPNMPDGTPQKLLDVSFLNSLGWRASTQLTQGLCKAYAWFVHWYDTQAGK